MTDSLAAGPRSGLTGDRPAQIMGATGVTITHAQLNDRSRRVARYLRTLGLERGDHIAILAENHPDFLTMAWAAQRSGLYYTPIGFRSSADELTFIVNDSGARIVVVTDATAALFTGARMTMPMVQHCITLGSARAAMSALDQVIRHVPADEPPDAVEGAEMPYSSGTTGRPKGIRPRRIGAPWGTPPPLVALAESLYEITPDAVYLCPGPLYHAGPLRFTMLVQRLGGTAVVMERFDARSALELIDRYEVTHAQFVPTMLSRMLALEPDVRRRFDVSSLRHVLVSAAPFPVPLKERLLEWWGPVVDEAYTGTEGNGYVAISAHDWLKHKGSVGRPVAGTVHILDEEGDELPPMERGTIYFEGGGEFEYHNAPEKTAAAHNELGWSTLGDVGYVDQDGYLYLTDRKDYVINSGGVNVYPQETERVLMEHPAVFEAAVFGIPNADFGEEVRAVIEVAEGADTGTLIDELAQHCRSRLAPYKCPRSIVLTNELPRSPAGKLLKRVLRDPYWATDTAGPGPEQTPGTITSREPDIR